MNARRPRLFRSLWQTMFGEREVAEPAPDWSPSVAMVDGFELHLPRHFRIHYVDRQYDPLTRQFILDTVAPGDLAIDVGAHIGLVGLWLSRATGPSGRVVMFEPAPENIAYIRRNLSANSIENVELLEVAATSRDSPMRLHLTGSSDSHGLYDHPNTATEDVIEVKGCRVDSVIEGELGFFKIDTEGAELDVLEGMTELLHRSPRASGIVEWTPACQRMAGRRPDELVEALHDFGFRLDLLPTGPGPTTVADACSAASEGRLSDDWYANLACRPR